MKFSKSVMLTCAIWCAASLLQSSVAASPSSSEAVNYKPTLTSTYVSPGSPGVVNYKVTLTKSESAPASPKVVDYKVTVTNADQRLVEAIEAKDVVGDPVPFVTSDETVESTGHTGWQFSFLSHKTDKGIQCNMSIRQFSKDADGSTSHADAQSKAQDVQLIIPAGGKTITMPLWDGMRATFTVTD